MGVNSEAAPSSPGLPGYFGSRRPIRQAASERAKALYGKRRRVRHRTRHTGPQPDRPRFPGPRGWEVVSSRVSVGDGRGRSGPMHHRPRAEEIAMRTSRSRARVGVLAALLATAAIVTAAPARAGIVAYATRSG